MEQTLINELLTHHSPVAVVAGIVFWLEHNHSKKRGRIYRKISKLEVSNGKVTERLDSIDATLKRIERNQGR